MAIAARTYRHAKSTGPSPRTVSDAELLDTLHGLKGSPESLYGRRKLVAHLRRLGHDVAHCTVDRLMGVAGMAGVSRRKSPLRDRRNKPEDRAADLLHRDFTAAAPNLVWGRGPYLRDDDIRLGVRRVHRRRLFPADRHLVRADGQGCGTGADPATPDVVGAQTRCSSGRP